ncbi:hypothetical protein [Aromatoleum bremense]|uniref:Uncharacterized protein n=1 Tax=Aromatoleum bremense TaxID=76115 RepID=A0ABX1NZ07_9RHOO|nr:hypothetical protein [Aromatoleum bremense]NMG16976.1 hypothetical protein [Aromatoleum bremense]QTQ33232.1 Uncharacterized protein pbN1_32460 [Aromatoleum bremense]
MKLNPFRKKSSGYFAGLQAELAEATAQLEATAAELAAAREDHAVKRDASRELEARHPQRLQMSPAEKAARLAANTAEQRVHELERALWNLQQRHSGLRQRIEAPQQLASAQATMTELGRQRHSLQAERDKAQALIGKIDARVTELTAQISAETEAASASMIEGDGAFVMPEALLRLDTELRVAQTTRTDLQARVESLGTELQAIPEALREARTRFLHARATVAELELHEQLPTLIELVARAAVSRHECHLSHPADRYEIEIARDVVEATQARLEAEVPAI